MAKNKRTNPKRIPVSLTELDKEDLIEQTSAGNFRPVWLIFLSALFDVDGVDASMVMRIGNRSMSMLAIPPLKESS